jgi:DNA-binding winged helix-turn-helix (wHTH) protein
VINLDLERRTAEVNKKPMDLTPKEFDLLAVLSQADGKFLSRQELQVLVWKTDAEMDSRSIDQHVARLRSKLKQYREAVATVTGYGYQVRPGYVTLTAETKAPAGQVSAIERIFTRDGKPAAKVTVVVPGLVNFKKGDKVRVGA